MAAQRTAIPTNRAAQTFQALRHRNFLLLWIGMAVSMTGRWVLITAQQLLVYKLTGSPFLLGIVGFCTAIPTFFLSPIGGAFADRMDRRKLLMVTQCSMMVCVLALATLASTGLIEVWHILLIAILTGAAMAFDMPTRQSLIPELVSKEDLTNAMALNNSVFHGTRIWGPTIAGLLVGPIGTGGCFYLTAVSYAGIIGALLLMKIPPRVSRAAETTIWRNLVEGFGYIRTSSLVLILVSMAAVSSIFGTAQRSLMVIFAEDVLKAGSSGFGFLMSASAVGAVIAALLIASLGDFQYKGRILLVGALMQGVALFLFSQSTYMPLSLGVLLFSGAGETAYLTMSNTILLVVAPAEMRGRVMSAYMQTSQGLTPLAALQGGTLAEFFGAPFAIGLGGSVCALSALVIAVGAPALRRFR
ncbi:MAG: hypothetical protein A2Y60_00765 [Chloroflexi bacterium RBG_13_54_9]|nr:MAG: hypothetical protein A2Y60_00765 [Chloroflexi bacterium RBG_13_54_9]